jgi:hypothetical protein
LFVFLGSARGFSRRNSRVCTRRVVEWFGEIKSDNHLLILGFDVNEEMDGMGFNEETTPKGTSFLPILPCTCPCVCYTHTSVGLMNSLLVTKDNSFSD